MQELFGNKEQHDEGANNALPKVQELLAAKYPDCTVTKEEGVAFPHLMIKGPKARLFIFAGAFCSFTLHDFNHPVGVSVFTSGPADEDKDRKIKPLKWSIDQLDAYLAAKHAE